MRRLLLAASAAACVLAVPASAEPLSARAVLVGAVSQGTQGLFVPVEFRPFWWADDEEKRRCDRDDKDDRDDRDKHLVSRSKPCKDKDDRDRDKGKGDGEGGGNN
jgi:hypothetical protein